MYSTYLDSVNYKITKIEIVQLVSKFSKEDIHTKYPYKADNNRLERKKHWHKNNHKRILIYWSSWQHNKIHHQEIAKIFLLFSLRNLKHLKTGLKKSLKILQKMLRSQKKIRHKLKRKSKWNIIFHIIRRQIPVIGDTIDRKEKKMKTNNVES